MRCGNKAYNGADRLHQGFLTDIMQYPMEAMQDEHEIMALPVEKRVELVRAEVEQEFGGFQPEIRQGGWNRVLLYRDAPQPYIVKVPLKDNDINVRAQLSMEFNALAFLIDTPNSPLEVPLPLNVPLKAPNYLATTLVPGRTFTQAEVLERFSKEELAAYGRAIAQFVLYERAALHTSDFDEAADDVSGCWYPSNDREEELVELWRHLRSSPIYEYPELYEAVIDTFHEYRAYLEDGCIKRDMIGHNDLRPDNVTFEQRDGLWQLRGVIDFGTAISTDIARELRHLPRLGEAALHAALEELGAHAAPPLPDYYEQYIKMWARVQVVTTAATCYNSNVQPPESILHDMERLHPGFDWSELKHRSRRTVFVPPFLYTESC
jgi:aminoglycoside phosphotransferase (APT) family kinase protein